VIVVVGRLDGGEVRSIAAAIAAGGGRIEVVGAAAPDEAGDRLLQAYATFGAGHAAVLRTPARDLEPADLELALRYLPDARAIVLVGSAELAPVAAAAAGWAGASLVVLVPPEALAPELADAERSIVLGIPARDPDAAFAGLVAALALQLDAGEPLAAAWSATLARLGAEAVSPGGARVSAAPPGSARPEAPVRARPGSGRRSGRR
jgi:hypothetical protein